MLAENTTTDVTSATAVAAATSVVRTGTRFRPEPASSANRSPTAAGTDAPAAVSAPAIRDRDPTDPWSTSLDERQAGHIATASPATTTAMAPIPSTVQSNATPGWTSATRTAPTGPSGDAATAIPSARIAPAATASAALISESTIRS